MSEPQTFEMPSSDGRTTWTVTFELQPGTKLWRDPEATIVELQISVTLISGTRRRGALLGISSEQAALSALPTNETLRNLCYREAAVRYCRRHLDEIIAQEHFTHLLSEADLALALNRHTGDTLLEIEHDIDAVLDWLPGFLPHLATLRPDERPFDAISKVWKKHEPNLRRMRDADKRFAEAYQTAAEFYKARQRYPRKASSTRQIEADLGEMNTLGHYAVRTLYAARQPARTPAPQGHSAGTNGGWPADRAVHLRRITVERLRCLEQVDVHLTPPEGTTKGQWLVLLGENGMGKTSILRAVALALLPEDAARNHVYELSGRAGLVRVRKAPDGRDVHEIVARIDVETGPGAATMLSIFQQRHRETLGVRSSLPQRPLVLGYGCRRGSALGDIRRESNTDYLLGTATLFDEDARVIHADTWLRDLRDQDRGLFDSVCRILSELLLGVERISVEPGGTTWVEGPVIGRVPLAGLSDGYLTTLGWLVDVLARWIAYARSHEIPLGPDFHKRMPCVVLIDEIDLHLHPRWQTEVITRLRDMFPMTTFVATTHNPLTLHGTQPGEVHVIRAGDDDNLEIVQKDLPPGIRTDELLTGEWFGLSSTLDADTQKLLKDHFALLQQGRPEGDPERVAIEEKLRTRLGHFAATLPEKLAHELVAEQLDPAANPVTDEDRARLRAMYEQRLRDAARALPQGEQSDEP